MSLIGLQIYLALKFNFLIPKKKISIFSLLLGFSIPEIDFFTHITNISTLFEKNITHSIISVAFIYLIFLIFYEIKKNEWVLKIANGFVFGMIVNIFLGSTGMQFIICILGVLIFTGLTAYDTQTLKEMYVAGESGETQIKKGVMGALKLYLDFFYSFQLQVILHNFHLFYFSPLEYLKLQMLHHGP